MAAGSSTDEIPFGSGELNIDEMSKILDDAPRSRWDCSHFSPDGWSPFSADNALLRAIGHGEIQNVKGDYFDDVLLNRCTNDWTDWLRVMGNAM